MRWPLVSRKRFERRGRVMKQQRARIAELESENAQLAECALNWMRHRAESKAVPAETPEAQAPETFTTPIDRVLSRFDQHFKPGTIPGKYRARAN